MSIRPRYGSLFSGIGGFDLGFDRAGMESAWQVEIDPKCREVLAYHWPNVERYNDVRQCGRDNLSPVDVICGGFPCQDLSVAGKRAGLDGERSGLWFQFHRIIAELGPRWVVIENVPGLLSSHKGRDFAIVLRGLVELGYGVSWRILDAQYFGVAQRRRRVFIVASLGDGRSAEVLFEREGMRGDTETGREAGEGAASDAIPCLAASGRGTERAGESRGQDPVIPIAVRPAQTGSNGWGILQDGSTHTLDQTGGDVVAYDIRNQEETGEITQTLQAKKNGGYSLNYQPVLAFGGNNTSGPIDTATACNAHGGQGRMDFESETFIAFSVGQSSRARSIAADENVTPPIRVGASGTNQTPTIAFAWQQGVSENDRSYPVRAGDYSGALSETRVDAVGGAFGVRRLTPTECERLQGFPDGWTFGSDSTRYRQLGNAVAVPVAEWIGRRLAEAMGVQS